MNSLKLLIVIMIDFCLSTVYASTTSCEVDSCNSGYCCNNGVCVKMDENEPLCKISNGCDIFNGDCIISDNLFKPNGIFVIDYENIAFEEEVDDDKLIDTTNESESAEPDEDDYENEDEQPTETDNEYEDDYVNEDEQSTETYEFEDDYENEYEQSTETYEFEDDYENEDEQPTETDNEFEDTQPTEIDNEFENEKKISTIPDDESIDQATKIIKNSRCGEGFGSCKEGYCCSRWGWCGKSKYYCDKILGCQSEFGHCRN